MAYTIIRQLTGEKRYREFAKGQTRTQINRREVLKRDGFRCVECEARTIEGLLHVDHILPVARGGKSTMSNLRTLCMHYILGKGAGE